MAIGVPYAASPAYEDSANSASFTITTNVNVPIGDTLFLSFESRLTNKAHVTSVAGAPAGVDAADIYFRDHSGAAESVSLVRLYARTAAIPSGTTFTVTLNLATSRKTALAWGCSGLDGNATSTPQVDADASTGAVSYGPIAPAGTSQLVVSVVQHNGAAGTDTIAAGAGWTAIQADIDGASSWTQGLTQYQVGAAGSYTATATTTATTTNWAGLLVTFAAAAAGGGGGGGGTGGTSTSSTTGEQRLLGPRYLFVVCKATGEPVGEVQTAAGRKLSLARNAVHQATVVVAMDDRVVPYIVPGQGRLKVYRLPSTTELAASPSAGRSLVFYGSLPAENCKVDVAAGTIEATYMDPRWVLARRYTSGTLAGGDYSFTNRTHGAILWALVAYQNARAQGDTWLRQGTDSTTTKLTVTYDVQQVSQVYDTITALDGGPDNDIRPYDEWSVNGGQAMAYLDVYGKQGTDRTGGANPVVFACGPGLASNCDDIAVTYQPVTNFSTWVGTAITGVNLTQRASAPQAAPSGYGLLEAYASFSDPTSNAHLLALANGDLTNYGTLRPVVQVQGITSEARRAIEEYGIGDTVLAVARKGLWSLPATSLRVDGLDLDIDQQGYETPSLVLA